MPIGLIIALLISGGVGFVSGESLPGDILYPIKININENFESAFAFTAKQDANVDIQHIAKRLDETEKLKAKGLISSEINSKLRKLFEEKIVDLNTHLNVVKNSGDSDSVEKINIELDNEIDSHFEAFSLIASSSRASFPLRDILKEADSRHKYISNNESDDSELSSANKDDDEVGSTNSRIKDDDEDDDDDDDEEEGDDRGVRVTNTTTITSPLSPSGSNLKTFTLTEVALHKTSMDCYTTINGSVYNLTPWINQHPGGQSAIISLCGMDGTADFTGQHGGQSRPASELVSFKIGILK